MTVSPGKGRTAAQAVAEVGRPPAKPIEINIKHVASAWQGFYLICQGVVWLVAGKTHRLEGLSHVEAMEDAENLWPIVERHPWLMRVMAWIGAPVTLVKRIAGKIKRKEPGNGAGAPGAVQGR